LERIKSFYEIESTDNIFANQSFGRCDMLSKELLDVLACPKCKGELEYNQKNEKLICHQCRLKYNIKENIPIMLIDEAEKF